MAANTLTNNEFTTVLGYVHARSEAPLRDTVALLLSFKAGMRVGEIAGLNWGDVMTAFGEIRSDTITVPARIAKCGSGRTIPMHPAIHAALKHWHAHTDRPRPRDPIITARRHNATGRVSANTLQRYFGRLYARVGVRLSSHSGRRSFITAAARNANLFGCSLKDVQRLAGHRDISTTEAYIVASDGVVDLVNNI